MNSLPSISTLTESGALRELDRGGENGRAEKSRWEVERPAAAFDDSYPFLYQNRAGVGERVRLLRFAACGFASYAAMARSRCAVRCVRRCALSTSCIGSGACGCR